MKKLYFALPLVLLLAAGCNSSKQANNSNTPTQNTNTSTTTTAQNNTLVTPQQLSRQDSLKAGVTYQDTELGYEFIAPSDVSYFKDELPNYRMISLIDDLGSNPKWLTITINPISVPYSNVIPSNLNLMSEVKSYLQPGSRLYTKIEKCNFNDIPCVRVHFKDNPPPSDDIFFVIKNQLMNISLSNSNPQGGNSQAVNDQAAQDYYQKFLSTFKVLPGSKN